MSGWGWDTHKHRRSLNVLVIGGSGAAKTRGYVKPNILEANTNYVITDPKMEVLTDTGGYLKRQGYDVRVLISSIWTSLTAITHSAICGMKKMR